MTKRKYYAALLYALLLALPLLASLPNHGFRSHTTKKGAVKTTQSVKSAKAHHPLDFLVK